VGDDPLVVLSDGDKPEGNAFLTWRTHLTGAEEIKYATDSFSWQLKEGKAKIWKQNIITTELGKPCGEVEIDAKDCTANQPLCDGWKNHFDTFGAGGPTSADNAGALEKIMKDYTAESIVQVFDKQGGDSRRVRLIQGSDRNRGHVWAADHGH